jgi:hypothetical protein
LNGSTREIRISTEPNGVVSVTRSTGHSLATLSGQIEGNSIRASGNESRGNRPCTLALTRVTEPGTSASASGASAVPSGTFAGDYSYPHGALRLSVRLDLVNGRGTLTVDAPGCPSSSLPVTVSPTGEVSGTGDFNCMVGSTGSQLSGRLTISGRREGDSFSIHLASPRGGLPSGNVLRLTRQFSAASAAPPTPRPAPPTGTFDGTYVGSVSGSAGVVLVKLEVTNGQGSGTISTSSCQTPIYVGISPTGDVKANGFLCTRNIPFTLEGRAEGERLTLKSIQGGQGTLLPGQEVVLTKGVPMATSSALPSPDGLWRGTYTCSAGSPSALARLPFTLDFEMRMASGSGTWKTNAYHTVNGHTLDVAVSVERDVVTFTRVFLDAAKTSRAILTGRYDGSTISASGMERNAERQCTLTLRRA